MTYFLLQFSCIVEPMLKTITEQMEDGSIHVVEKVKRGRFSIRADIPNLPKLVVRITRNVNIRDQLSVFCPTAEERVFWKKGNDRKDSLVLSSAFLHSASAGRMYLDESSSLVFTEVLQSDDGMYSCWSYDDILLMSAEIIVSDPSKELTLRLTLIGVAITTLSIAIGYVIYNVLSLRRSHI
uniref:Ig-like domain-containing protein n=1 Tax=Romanomermis culicivorax TaxID=13658 RepID=A0A915K9D0_ROMCU